MGTKSKKFEEFETYLENSSDTCGGNVTAQNYRKQIEYLDEYLLEKEYRSLKDVDMNELKELYSNCRYDLVIKYIESRSGAKTYTQANIKNVLSKYVDYYKYKQIKKIWDLGRETYDQTSQCWTLATNANNDAKKLYKDIKVGDLFFIKTTGTQKNNLPFNAGGETVAFTNIHAFGEITSVNSNKLNLKIINDYFAKCKTWYGAGTNWKGLLNLNIIKYHELYDFISDPQNAQNYKLQEVFYQSKQSSSTDNNSLSIETDTSTISTPHTTAYNKIFYGVPGCGKSYHIEHNVLDEIFQNCGGKKEKNIFRTIFYQDYSHADFVGQYMPKRIKGQVEYTFVPKVFTKALERAYQCPNEPVVLVIEEINRGDAASIFGDIFQLLDRDKDGKSEYEIDCDEIVDYLSAVENKNEVITNIVGENGKEGTNKIYIPSNLYLLATMNTCDQNVFALDTAFKRRWDMEEIPNEFKKDYEIKDMLVPYNFDGTYITWEKFVKVVNKQNVNSSDEFFGDDRQIGCFFVDDTCLLDTANDTGTNKAENFAYKVIAYLWNDVAKLNRNEWFEDSANDGVKTLHSAITKFVNGNDVFSSTLKTELLKDESQPSALQAEAEENESIEE